MWSLRLPTRRCARWIVACLPLIVAAAPRSAGAQEAGAVVPETGGATVVTRRIVLSGRVSAVTAVDAGRTISLASGPAGGPGRFRLETTVRSNVPSRLVVAAPELAGPWILRPMHDAPQPWDGSAAAVSDWLPPGRHTIVWELEAPPATSGAPVLRYEVETASPPTGARPERLR